MLGDTSFANDTRSYAALERIVLGTYVSRDANITGNDAALTIKCPQNAADVGNGVGIALQTSPYASREIGLFPFYEEGDSVNVLERGRAYVLVNTPDIQPYQDLRVITANNATLLLPKGHFSNTGGTVVPNARFVSTARALPLPFQTTTFSEADGVTRAPTTEQYAGYALAEIG